MMVRETKQQTVLWGVIVIAVMLAGCTDPAGSGGNNGPSVEGIAVQGPSCTVDGSPCSSADLTVYSIPKITMTLENTADEQVMLPMNDRGPRGQGILEELCDTYRIKEFIAVKRDTAGRTNDIRLENYVELEPGEKLELEWYVELADRSRNEVSCTMDFGLRFEQRLETIRQVQVKGDEDVEDVTGLEARTSATAPVELVVDVEQTIVQNVIGGEVAPFQATAYLVNRGRGEITFVDHFQRPDRIYLDARGVNGRECSQQDVVTGRNNTRTAKVCSFTPPRITHSQLFDVMAETMYEYERDLGRVTLDVGALEARR